MFSLKINNFFKLHHIYVVVDLTHTIVMPNKIHSTKWKKEIN